MDYLSRNIKQNLIVRLLMYPYMRWSKKKAFQQYKESLDSLKIQTLKGKESGKRCFIIGNGSSLRVEDLEKLKNEITFACNRIYNIFDKTSWRPTYYMAVDTDGLDEMAPCVLNKGISHIFLNEKAKKNVSSDNDDLYWEYLSYGNGGFVINIFDDKSIHISEDVSKCFIAGYTVTFSAIQLAIYLGIREIYLIGVDFNYSLYTDKWGRKKKKEGVTNYFDGKNLGSYLNYHSTMRAYQKAKEYCDEHGIRIANATRGGCLEVFERQDFDKLMGGGKSLIFKALCINPVACRGCNQMMEAA